MRLCPECGAKTETKRCATCGVDTVPIAAPEKERDPLLGQVFAERFRVARLIGKGGMGAVYEAHQLSMGRAVALKVMLSNITDVDAVRRFYREARASSRLEHPNTIRVFDYGTDESGRQFIAMELLTGEPLSAVLRREKTITPDRVVSIATQVAKSLGEAHAAGLVHRDLKPDNIYLCELYGEQDFVKVLDLGIARFTCQDEVTSALTKAGMTVGTCDYMSPEQVMAAELDGRSDLFALGLIMYRCLVGRLPFPAVHEVGSLPAAVARRDQEAARLVREDCPPELAGLIANAV